MVQHIHSVFSPAGQLSTFQGQLVLMGEERGRVGEEFDL